MEKFSTWRDKGTGIAPFIPLSLPKTPLRRYLINPILIAFKFPVFVVLYWLSLFASKPIIAFIFSWLFGIAIDTLVDGVRKLNKAETKQALPDKNTMVVCNLTSPLDIFSIFLKSKISSLKSLAVVVPIDGTCYVLTPWELAFWCFQPIGLKCGTKLSSQNEKILKNKLVVAFAEGTTSNNRAILAMSSAVEPVLALPGFSYQTTVLLWYPNAISIAVPVLSPIQYVSGLLTLSSGSYVKMKITAHVKGSLTESKRIYQENGVNIINLGVADKKKFFEYYQSQSN